MHVAARTICGLIYPLRSLHNPLGRKSRNNNPVADSSKPATFVAISWNRGETRFRVLPYRSAASLVVLSRHHSRDHPRGALRRWSGNRSAGDGSCGIGCGHRRDDGSVLGISYCCRKAGYEDRIVDVRPSLLGAAVAFQQPGSMRRNESPGENRTSGEIHDGLQVRSGSNPWQHTVDNANSSRSN